MLVHSYLLQTILVGVPFMIQLGDTGDAAKPLLAIKYSFQVLFKMEEQ